MTIEELTALLEAELRDDLNAEIHKEGGALKIVFSDGTVRTVTVG